jgi:SAM-dependent methyltransferase
MSRATVHKPQAGEWPSDELEAIGQCPVCATPQRRVLYDDLGDRLFAVPGRWRLWRCTACGAAYLDPRPAPHAIARAYPGSYYTHEDPAEALAGAAAMVRTPVAGRILVACVGILPLLPRSTRNDASLAATRRTQDPNTASTPRLLDVGCGGGALLARMRSQGWEVEGIDVDPGALKVARAAGLPVRHATLTDLAAERPLRQFDVITLDHVLEHLHDPVGSLRAARRLLRPGGVLWLATPNLAALGHRSFGRSWMSLDPPRHLVLFSPGALQLALRAAGFAEPVAQRAARTACWVFPASEAIGKGEDPLTTRARGPGLRLKGLLADLSASRRPELGEELVIAAGVCAGENGSSSA